MVFAKCSCVTVIRPLARTVKVECVFFLSRSVFQVHNLCFVFVHQDCHSIQQADLPCLESPDAEVRRSVGHGHPWRQRDAQVTWHEEWVSILRPQRRINHIKECSDLSAAWYRVREALCLNLKGNENHWTYMNFPSIFLAKVIIFVRILFTYIHVYQLGQEL